MNNFEFQLSISILLMILIIYSYNSNEYFSSQPKLQKNTAENALFKQLQPSLEKKGSDANKEYQPYLKPLDKEEITLNKLLSSITAENSESNTKTAQETGTTGLNDNANSGAENAKKTTSKKNKVLSFLKDISKKAAISEDTSTEIATTGLASASASASSLGQGKGGISALSPDELKKIEDTDYTIIGNITKLFTPSQSSRNPFNKYGPRLSIDDNLTTYSSTNIIKGYPSWIQYLSTENIEIRQIVITGRLGSYEIKKRLVPFNITIYFNDVIIGTQRFVEVQDNYYWKNVNLIGNKIKIVQELVTYLEIANFMITGRLAQKNCEKYAKKTASLYTSCKKTLALTPVIIEKPEVNPYLGLTQEEIKLAKEFEKVLQKEEIAAKIKSDKAEKLWKIIQAQIKKEADVAQSAGKLGMKAPPPLYTQQQIDAVKKYLPKKKIKLSGIDKANCMRSLNQYSTLNNQAIIAGRESQLLPYRQDDAKRYTQEAEAVLTSYKKICIT